MSNILIRKAQREDCPRLMELIRGLADYEKMPDEVTVALSHFEESGFGPNPVWWGFVAETDGMVYGFALYYIRYSTWKGQRLWLEDLYVDPHKRGQKLGAMLFDRLIEEARAKGYSGMNWQALDWNEPALNFYRKYKANFDPSWVNCSIDF